MITILEKSREFTNIETYLMTCSPAALPMNKVEDGEVIRVAGFLTYTDEKQDGTTLELTSIITPERAVYTFQSKTFKNELLKMVELFDGEFSIIKTSGKTANGREYISCQLDLSSVE